MTKQELLDLLGLQCKRVYLPTLKLVQDSNDVNVYTIQTDQAEGLAQVRGVSVSFKVFDEGQADEEEALFVSGMPSLPIDKNTQGMAYLGSKVLDGTIAGFELKNSRPDLGIFSFFEVEVVTPGGGAFEVSRQTWRVQEGPGGVPFHMVVTG